MLVTHTANLSEFARLLGDSPDEVNILIKEILIGVTNFFRDPAFFEKLKYNAVYKIVERAREDEPIRVWSAGCSTGEEAYSIAILFQEAMEELQVKRDVKIFATDVDSRAIEQAGRGIYSENIIDDVTPDRLAKFFLKQNDQYQISKEIRRMIVFATHNMFSDPPFGKLDLISCRNVMIYFQPVLRRGLFAIFHSALKNGGFLFLGKSETAGEYVNLFKPVCSAEKIYLHKGEGKVEDLTPPTFNIPNIQALSLKRLTSAAGQSGDSGAENLYTKFMEAFLPASVVLSEDDTVLHFFGDYSNYLTLAPGKATLNFFSMLNKDLSLVAATAVSRCRTGAQPGDLYGYCGGLSCRPEGGGPGGPGHPAGARRGAGAHGGALFGAQDPGGGGRGGEVRHRRHRRPADRRPGAGVPGVPERPEGHHSAAGDGERRAAGGQRGAAHRQRGAPVLHRGAAVGERGAVHREHRASAESWTS